MAVDKILICSRYTSFFISQQLYLSSLPLDWNVSGPTFGLGDGLNSLINKLVNFGKFIAF